MKNFALRLSIVFCLLLFASFSFAQTPLAANGKLQLINRQLCNESGTPIQLRGMSSHGLHWFPQCFTQSSVNALANDWGADVFRAAMYVDEGGYLNDKAGLRNKVNQIVDWSEQAGMYCIIDWHILNPGDPNIHTADAIEFFQIMAQRNAGKKNVIYEICNEPNGVNWASIKNYAEQVIPVIRQYAPDAIILVGTPNYSGTPGDVRGNMLSGANAHNVMYTFHFYAGSHFTQNYIDDVIKTVPLFMSEWGTSNYSGNGGDNYSNAQNWVDLMAGNNSSGIKLSWCNWNFADKNETSSALNPGACSNAAWNNTSTSGTWVKQRILNPADDFGPATPFVSITSPANNSTVNIGSSLTITASAGNATVSKVEFYKGATKLGEDATVPYTFTITKIAAGTYSFTAKAILDPGEPITSLAVQVTAAPAPNQPPIASITSPASNATFTAPASVTITASAADSDGNVSKVEFYQGNTKLGEDATAPYEYTWTNVAAGSYTLTAKAFDNQNAIGTSSAVTIYVNNPGNPSADLLGPDCVSTNQTKLYELNATNLPNATNFSWWCTGSTQSITAVSGQPQKVNIDFGSSFTGGQVCVGVNYSAAPWYKQFCKSVSVCTGTPPPPPTNQAPTVSLTTPTSNATFTAPATIPLAANAADSDGSVTKVEFYNGGTKLGEDAAAPYEFAWNNVAAGTYNLTAKATDNQGATTTSAVVPVTVNAAPVNQAPTISLTAPSNNATFTAPATISMTANAVDSDGSVAKVEFYNGSTKLGEKMIAPYNFSWTNVAAGAYTLTAKATDNQGASTISGAVSVTVNSSTPPPNPTADITGLDCVTPNQTSVFELNANKLPNATNFSWWCTGSTQSMTQVPGQPSKVSINFGPWFTGGQVCVGVNYSAAPWYKQYCKSVSVCSTARLGVVEGETSEAAGVVYPNPSSVDFTFIADKDIREMKVHDLIGYEHLKLGTLQRGKQVRFGESLSIGVYVLKVEYNDRTTRTFKVLKVGK